jgi:dolichyl-phosphate-mannose-protein mannosyltransferase
LGGVLAAAGIGYAALALPWLGRRVVLWLGLGLALGVALVVGAVLTAAPVGLKASYWAGSSPSGSPERSTEFTWLTDATRIEPTLDLRGEDFGVLFFNDASRFNFGPDVVPGRDQLAFAVRWEGWLVVQSTGPRRFVLDSTGPARVVLDGKPLDAADVMVGVSAGLHPLRVDYARPEAKVPLLRLRWQRERGGDLVPMGGEDVRWRAEAGTPQVSAVLNAVGMAALMAVALTAVALGAWRLVRRAIPAQESASDDAEAEANRRSRMNAAWRAALGLLPLAFAAYGALLDAPLAGKAVILSGLDDWLIYESQARDILLNGLLMDGGQGHAAPFYGQPLYPYVLALVHRLVGESLFGPIVVQYAALGAVAVGTAVLARKCFGQVVDGLVALAAFLALLQLEPEHFKIARQLFNENLYMPLVMASLIRVVAFARRDRPVKWWQSLLTGCLLGLTAISRSQFLLFVPFGLLVLWLAWRRHPSQATAMVGLILLGTLLTIAPIAARNLVVSGEFVPISSSGGASLLEFHRPPPGLIDQSELQRDAIFNALRLDQNTRTVLAFAERDPLGYAATLLPLGAHSIGLKGRNDPGIYWPLLITCALYAASFLLERSRRLHVWPIHAFVGTHLLILMLFEADTYGYRLVMPMYAPMVAVAAQLPLEFVRRALRSSAGAALRSGEAQRATRFAVAGWGAIALGALVWQAGGVVAAWPDREPALHGLGGAAAHAALTSDQARANAIYVASVDGSPRRFGAGVLPGLRYPWFKWFDPQRSLPLPPEASRAVYMLSELRGQQRTGDLTDCLGPTDDAGEVVVAAEQARAACVGDQSESTIATFDGLARIDSLTAPAEAGAGETLETRVVWQPLTAHPEPRQVSLQLDDPAAGDGILWGNGTLELYPAAEWQTDELVLSRIPVATDATAIPQNYRLTIGMASLKPGSGPDLATLAGGRTDRVAAGGVALTPGMAQVGASLPPDMHAIEGPPLVGGGLELIGARPLPNESAVGSPLRVGLLWRALQDSPSATRVRLRLVGGAGNVLQETALPLLGGRVAPSTLRAGNVVRDEQSFIVSPSISGQAYLELSVEDAWQRLGGLKLTGRAHTMDTSGAAAVATFGGAMDLLSASVEPASGAKAGDKVTVQLRWRAARAMPQAYKIFVHVLDATGQQVVAQRDAEPEDGAAPTTSWVAGEVLADSYLLVLPPSLGGGEYPIEVGVYDPRTGDRLSLGNGDNHLVLATRLSVR